MKNASRSTLRWWAALRKRPAIALADDAADHGTAFGLELSMLPVEASPARPAAPRARGWMARLVRRGGAA